MNRLKPSIHFVDNFLINPTNPISVHLIGTGGTGSQVLTALSKINYSLLQLRHPGINVTVFDDDMVTPANLGRQLFAQSEIGLSKAVALINRINRFFGTNWKAEIKKIKANMPDNPLGADITLSCVDAVQARFDIYKLLQQQKKSNDHRLRPLYWMDFGNSLDTGQVIVSTVSEVSQPQSKKFSTVERLPAITQEYKNLLNNTVEEDLPSCSLAEALMKQDLFINPALADLGCSILWSMFREGMLRHRGFFLNLKTLHSQPISLIKT